MAIEKLFSPYEGFWATKRSIRGKWRRNNCRWTKLFRHFAGKSAVHFSETKASPPPKKKNWLCALCYSVQLVNNCKSCKCCFVTLSINAILKDVWRLVKTTCSDQQITFCYYSSPGHTKRFFKIFLVFKKTTCNRQSRFRYSCTGSVKWKIGSRGIAKYHDLFNLLDECKVHRKHDWRVHLFLQRR